MPGFRLSDPAATASLTARHLLTHTGGPRCGAAPPCPRPDGEVGPQEHGLRKEFRALARSRPWAARQASRAQVRRDDQFVLSSAAFHGDVDGVEDDEGVRLGRRCLGQWHPAREREGQRQALPFQEGRDDRAEQLPHVGQPDQPGQDRPDDRDGRYGGHENRDGLPRTGAEGDVRGALDGRHDFPAVVDEVRVDSEVRRRGRCVAHRDRPDDEIGHQGEVGGEGEPGRPMNLEIGDPDPVGGPEVDGSAAHGRGSGVSDLEGAELRRIAGGDRPHLGFGEGDERCRSGLVHRGGDLWHGGHPHVTLA
ncbi:hypothetical protein AB0L44_37860 [Nonomuraea wenchangensis]|uniref:hypothetical protein n=1 Tax=Nonomuraea wenchangensis TaxID=568860 RepID=UPI003435F98B